MKRTGQRLRPMMPWQLEAFDYTMGQCNPALIMDMRLGKCLVVIRRCKTYVPRSKAFGLRVLVVAPSSALEGWKTELEREQETGIILSGTRECRHSSLQEIRRWTLINKEAFLAIPEIANIRWDAVIVDESTFLKNPRAKVTKFFLRNFRSVPHKWILTGTPAVTDTLDWVCQLLFADGVVLGYRDYWSFRAEMCRVLGYSWELKDKKQLLDLLSKRCFIRSRADVGVYDKRERVSRVVELPENIRKLYKKAEEDFELDGKWVMYATQRYNYLRQLASGFSGGKLIWDGKFQELEYLLQEQVDGQCVIWFAFNQELHEAAYRLKCPGLTGDNSFEDRMQTIDRFREGKHKYLCMQVAIGKMGLDLSCADSCVYFSKPTSPEAYIQSKERIYNIMKRRVLLQIDVLSRGTVDEDVATTMDDRIFTSRVDLELALMRKMKERNKQCDM